MFHPAGRYVADSALIRGKILSFLAGLVVGSVVVAGIWSYGLPWCAW
jgi:hypothetical protein